MIECEYYVINSWLCCLPCNIVYEHIFSFICVANSIGLSKMKVY